jgi:hypothetical protein
MSKETSMVAYTSALENLNYTVDADFLNTVVNSLGPSGYDSTSDAAVVAGKDPEEIARVIENLFVKKLGMTDMDKANNMLEAALAKYVSTSDPLKSNPRKYRAVIYYMVVVDNKLQSSYNA